MSIAITRGKTDKVIKGIVVALRRYEADHPKAQIDLYRQNPCSVRVRIVDPDFAGKNEVARSKSVWKYFAALSHDTQSDISMLILMVPGEKEMRFANLEFEDPVPALA
jgi:hypothetical protein